MQFVDIIGSGAWGTTLAMLISQKKDTSVRVIARREDIARSIHHNHRNDAHLCGIMLPENVQASTLDSASLEKTTHLILAVPAQHMRSTLLHKIFGTLNSSALMLHAAKGLEHYTADGKLSGKRMSEVIKEELNRNASVLSGPNLASEIVQKRHACSVIASHNEGEAKAWQSLLSIPDRFEVETCSDVIGVEVAGALKNVIAIGAGINDGISIRKGLPESLNEKAEIIIKALGGIIAYGEARGADRNTFYGIAGMGDIMATCFSRESRNHFIGQEVGKSKTLEKALEKLKKRSCGEPEGPETIKVLYEISKSIKVRMPLTEACYNVLFNGKDPEKELKEFLKS